MLWLLDTSGPIPPALGKTVLPWSISILSSKTCVCCSSVLTTKPLQLRPQAHVTRSWGLLAAGWQIIALYDFRVRLGLLRVLRLPEEASLALPYSTARLRSLLASTTAFPGTRCVGEGCPTACVLCGSCLALGFTWVLAGTVLRQLKHFSYTHSVSVAPGVLWCRGGGEAGVACICGASWKGWMSGSPSAGC